MKFISRPEDFTPVDAGLVYTFDTESDEPRDIEVSVIQYDTEEIAGRLMIRNITHGSFDIAPCVRRFIDPHPPMQRGTMLVEAPCNRFVVEIDGVQSQPIVVAENRTEAVIGSWFSTMPEQRRIANGERDEIRIFCPPESMLEASVVADNGMTITCELAPENGAAVLRIDTADFPDDSQSLEVRIGSLRRIRYSFAKRYPNSLRLAWVSSAGSIERYTFPLVRRITRNTSRATVTEADGFRRTTGCESERCVRIVSDYERKDVIEALADIARSPKVWIEIANTFTEVEVLTASSTLYEYGKPCRMDIDLRIADGKEVMI